MLALVVSGLMILVAEKQNSIKLANDADMSHQQPVYFPSFSNGSNDRGWRGIECQFLSDVLFHNDKIYFKFSLKKSAILS